MWVEYRVYTSFWGLQCTSIKDANFYDCDTLFSFHGTQERFDKLHAMGFFMFLDLMLNVWGMYEMTRNKLNEFYRNNHIYVRAPFIFPSRSAKIFLIFKGNPARKQIRYRSHPPVIFFKFCRKGVFIESHSDIRHSKYHFNLVALFQKKHIFFKYESKINIRRFSIKQVFI